MMIFKLVNQAGVGLSYLAFAQTCWNFIHSLQTQSARLLSSLNVLTDDFAILVSAGKLRAPGKSKPNAVKFFSAIELITLLADSDGLDKRLKPSSSSGGERTPNAMV